MAKSKRKHGPKRRRKRQWKSPVKRRNTKKLSVKKQFKKAIAHLRQMKPAKQRAAVVGASNMFIRDVSSFMKRLRNKPHLVKPAHQKVLKRHKQKLKKLVNAKTPIYKKRLILYQHGGQIGGQFISILLPIILAAIGAGGTIGGSAVAATIMKN